MLRALDLTKSYDGAPLFDGLSLTLDPGERAGLVGPNGAGKTTLLRILAGLGPRSRGGGGRHATASATCRRTCRTAAAASAISSGARPARRGRCAADLDRLEDRLAAGDATEATLAAYGRAQAR